MFSTYGHASFVTTYAQAVHIKSADMFSALRGRTYCTAPARRIAGTGIDGFCQCASKLSVARSYGTKKKWRGRFQALGVKLLYVFTPMLRPLSSTKGYCLWSNVLACGSGKAGAREREERCREGVRQVWQGRQRSEGAQPSRKSFLGYWRHICSSCDIIQVAQASTSNIPANILKPMTSVIFYSP